MSYDLKMAEQSDSQQTAKIPQQLTLRSGVCSVDTKDETDVVFKDKEIDTIRKAHKSVLSQASPFFDTWFKEQWQKEKATTEYPVPGDIDWEVFTNVILFLYGTDIQFEEEALPKIYSAADFLQLGNMKEVIVTSLATQWELKEPSIVGAMCTAIVPHTDPRVVSGLLYMVSKHYLIKNIPTIVENDDIDISPLPFNTVMEIAQSEEVAAPEIQLYHFLKKWAEKHKHSLTFMEVQNLFGHVRYATIPYPQLETIRKYALHNNEKLQSALSEAPDFKEDETVEVKQFVSRKSQEGRLLLNGSNYKKWTTKVTELSSTLYTVISDKRKGAIVLTRIPKDSSENTTSNPWTSMKFDIISLPKSRAKQNTSTKIYKWYALSSRNRQVWIRNTVILHATPTGIEAESQDECTLEDMKFTEPFPWLVTIAKKEEDDATISVQTV